MKKVLFFACALFAGMAVTSCSNEDDLTTVSVSDTQTDLSAFRHHRSWHVPQSVPSHAGQDVL
jgi:hypothetical protein